MPGNAALASIYNDAKAVTDCMIPFCPLHKIEMRPPYNRKLSKDAVYFLCPKPGCGHRYRESEGYFTTTYSE